MLPMLLLFGKMTKAKKNELYLFANPIEKVINSIPCVHHDDDDDVDGADGTVQYGFDKVLLLFSIDRLS